MWGRALEVTNTLKYMHVVRVLMPCDDLICVHACAGTSADAVPALFDGAQQHGVVLIKAVRP